MSLATLPSFHVHYEQPGGAGGAPTPPVPPAPPAAPPAPPPAAPPAPPAGGPAPGSQPAPPATESDQDRMRRLESELTQARKDAARYRTRNDDETAGWRELHTSIGKMLGTPSGTNEPPDPAKILQQFQERDSKREKELRDMKVDLALTEVYSKQGVDPKLTKALLASDGALAAFDPDDADFPKTLSAAVKKLADDNPRLKVGPALAPSKSGGEFPGGASAPPQLTREQLKGMTPDQINEAREKGQLDQVLNRL